MAIFSFVGVMFLLLPTVLGQASDYLNTLEGQQHTSEELLEIKAFFEKKSTVFDTKDLIQQAFDVIATYEKDGYHVFKKRRKYPIKGVEAGTERDRAFFALQQALIDSAFVKPVLDSNVDLFKGKRYVMADYFPGKVAEGSTLGDHANIILDASNPEFKYIPPQFSQRHARHATGTYLPPGTVGTVVVPDSIVNKVFNTKNNQTFRVRVGVHSKNMEKKVLLRPYRASTVFDITSSETYIANPLGGSIYIEVPYGAEAGAVEITVRNAIRSPLLSGRSVFKTSKSEWANEMKHGAPWADVETDKFMLTVPTPLLKDIVDADKLLKDWDEVLDLVNDLMGRPHKRGVHVWYASYGLQMGGVANFPGYPTFNDKYSINALGSVKGRSTYLRGPQYVPYAVLHELGHASKFSKFPGERESVVNILYVLYHNELLGESLDESYVGSETGFEKKVCIRWMANPVFQRGDFVKASEKSSGKSGMPHYIEMVKLFGWGPLQKFWKAENDDVVNGGKNNQDDTQINDRIIRMSRAAGVDLTPLMEFWGNHPTKDGKDVVATNKVAGLPLSSAIYDRLKYYKSIIPKNLEEFATASNESASKYPTTWSQGLRKKSINVVEKIIKKYFPDGRPTDVYVPPCSLRRCAGFIHPVDVDVACSTDKCPVAPSTKKRTKNPAAPPTKKPTKNPAAPPTKKPAGTISAGAVVGASSALLCFCFLPCLLWA